MKKKQLPWVRIGGFTGVTLVMAWLILRLTAGSSYLQFLTDDYSFFASPRIQNDRGNEPWEFNFDIQGRWVNDVDNDEIPDLVLASREQAPTMSKLWGMEDWVWVLRVYSGADGSVIHDTIWDDPGVKLIAILGSDGSVGSIRYLVKDWTKPVASQQLGTQSYAEDFRALPFNDVWEWELDTSLYPTLNGPAIFHDFPNTAVTYLDSAIPNTRLELLDSSIPFFIPPDDVGAPAKQLALLWQDYSDSSVKEIDSFRLQTFDLPGGKVRSDIKLQFEKRKTFDPDRILAAFDFDGDGIKDWFIEHWVKLASGHGAHDYIWINGSTGYVLSEATQLWERAPSALLDNPYPNCEVTATGMFDTYNVFVPDPLPTLEFRPWKTGKPAWQIYLHFTPDWFSSIAQVTEFPDLDGDGHPEFGIFLDSMAGGKSIPGVYIMPDWEIEAHLVSGATGKPLMETWKAK